MGNTLSRSKFQMLIKRPMTHIHCTSPPVNPVFTWSAICVRVDNVIFLSRMIIRNQEIMHRSRKIALNSIKERWLVFTTRMILNFKKCRLYITIVWIHFFSSSVRIRSLRVILNILAPSKKWQPPSPINTLVSSPTNLLNLTIQGSLGWNRGQLTQIEKKATSYGTWKTLPRWLIVWLSPFLFRKMIKSLLLSRQ